MIFLNNCGFVPIKISLVAQVVKSLPVMQVTWVQSLSHEDPLEKMEWPPIPVSLGLPWCSGGKEPACNAGDLALIPVLGRSLGQEDP